MSKDSSTSNLVAAVLIGFTVFAGYYAFVIEFPRRQIPVESVPGAILFGFFLLLYLGWFALDTFFSEEEKSFSQALAYNAKKNPAFWTAYAYYLIFGYAVVDAAF